MFITDENIWLSYDLSQNVYISGVRFTRNVGLLGEHVCRVVE